MKPELYYGDCLRHFPQVAAGSVDMVFADLPYKKTGAFWDQSLIAMVPFWKEIKRVLKPRGVVLFTATQPFTTFLISSNPAWFKYPWVWDKIGLSGHLNSKKRPSGTT
jgi:site-specific DNA-methyltransferase (adenine-specific)